MNIKTFTNHLFSTDFYDADDGKDLGENGSSGSADDTGEGDDSNRASIPNSDDDSDNYRRDNSRKGDHPDKGAITNNDNDPCKRSVLRTGYRPDSHTNEAMTLRLERHRR